MRHLLMLASLLGLAALPVLGEEPPATSLDAAAI